DVRGETGGEAAEAQVREAMPGALVARREREKAGVRPGIGKVAGTPGRLEAKTDLAGRVVLAQQKPLPASFQVPIERVDGDGAKGAGPVGVCAGGDDPRRAEVAQPQDVNLQQEGAPPHRLVRMEVSDDDPRVGVLEATDRLPEPLVDPTGCSRRLARHAGLRADVVVAAAEELAWPGVEVAPGAPRRREGPPELLLGPAGKQAPLRSLRRRGRWAHCGQDPEAPRRRGRSPRG